MSAPLVLRFYSMPVSWLLPFQEGGKLVFRGVFMVGCWRSGTSLGMHRIQPRASIFASCCCQVVGS
jgi:hypothetical protein